MKESQLTNNSYLAENVNGDYHVVYDPVVMEMQTRFNSVNILNQEAMALLYSSSKEIAILRKALEQEKAKSIELAEVIENNKTQSELNQLDKINDSECGCAVVAATDKERDEVIIRNFLEHVFKSFMKTKGLNSSQLQQKHGDLIDYLYGAIGQCKKVLAEKTANKAD